MRKSLRGTWLLNSSYLERRNINNLKVTVPGSIYNDLLRYHLIDEPYYRDNESKMLEIMEDDFSYSRTFKVSNSEINKELNLVFLGLDTVTEIYVNEKLVTKTFNMHRRYLVNINEYAHVGENKLEVVIKSPLDFIRKEEKKLTHELMNMEYAVKGYAGIRKAHSMFGWDWGPQMPDGGIWRDLFLEVIDKGIIEDVLVYQDTDLDKAKLTIKVNNYYVKGNLVVSLRLSNGDYEYQATQEIEDVNVFSVVIDKPNLWYPVGYGSQPLYDLEVKLVSQNKVEDLNKQRIGLRKMEIIQEDDEYGRSFVPTVNGKKIFIKGSDYIIEDNILPRAGITHTEFLLDSAVACNQNCLRVWGGGLYPSDEFYNLCDEKGILIWQDLMFACGYYNMENEDFVGEIKEEILDNVRRIHNHACLMLICGNNENETAALNWNIPSAEYTKKWYLYQYEELIPSLLKKDAYDIFYWPSSPSSGGGFNDPNSDNKGDMHYWGVWHNNEPIENYRLYYPRLLSEFGMQSFPCMKTINEFTIKEDRNIYSYVMERHQKNRSANQKIMNYIGSMFKYPKNLEFISYVSELIQAEAVKYCVEHLRRNYPRCMGAIYWQLNDCWPVASWSSIDYYGRYKALQYYSKKFYSDVLVSIEEDNTTSLVYTENIGKESYKVVLSNLKDEELTGSFMIELLKFDGSCLYKYKDSFVAFADSTTILDAREFNLTRDEQMSSVLRVIVKDKNNKEITRNEVSFLRDKYLQFKKPNISYELSKNGNNYTITLLSDTYTKYVWVDLKNEDVIFSDNYFSLYKDERKVITFSSEKEIKNKDIKIINLTDSY